MGHYKNRCPNNSKNKKRKRDEANVVTNNNPQKKYKNKEREKTYSIKSHMSFTYSMLFFYYCIISLMFFSRINIFYF